MSMLYNKTLDVYIPFANVSSKKVESGSVCVCLYIFIYTFYLSFFVNIKCTKFK